jgi:hypothetical protein
LVAEEVAAVNPDLVVRDKIYTVRYDAVNAMLLTVQEQKATIAQLKQDFAELQKQIEGLTTDLQKVTAQLQVSKPVPQTAVNVGKAARAAALALPSTRFSGSQRIRMRVRISPGVLHSIHRRPQHRRNLRRGRIRRETHS